MKSATTTETIRKPRRPHEGGRCELAVMARRLLAGAGMGYHPDAAFAIIDSAPRTKGEAESPDPSASFCAFCLNLWASRRGLSDQEYREFEEVASYWLERRPCSP